MAIPIQRLVAAASLPAGYEQPYEMLHACHDRVQRMLDLLQRLVDHLAGIEAADDQARQAARDVMRYFDLAAPQHHLDEERHVLPRLEGSGDGALVALAQRLRADHRAMEVEWAAARQVLDTLADGTRPQLDAQARAVLARFAGRYAGHLQAEDTIAFPAARAATDPAALRAMAGDMMARRGIG